MLGASVFMRKKKKSYLLCDIKFLKRGWNIHNKQNGKHLNSMNDELTQEWRHRTISIFSSRNIK